MKLTYNDVDLAGLGTLRILSHQVAREPAEAPQRERVTYRMRLDFFESSYADNHGLIEQLRAALKTQQATLLWQDENGTTYLNRPVTAGEDEAVEEAGSRGGTYWQAVVFTFWFYNHDVATACLSALITPQRVDGTPDTGQDLGAVERWEEELEITRWDDLRAARKLVRGGVSASGRFQADTTQPVDTRQTQLLQLKDRLVAGLMEGAEVTLKFGTFNRKVRVTRFRAEVNQPNNQLAWNLSVTYTAYPDETDYAWLDLRLTTRENREEAIPRVTLSGRIGAPTLNAAQVRLAALKTSLAPTGYVTVAEETNEPRFISESGIVGSTDHTNQADGTVFTELSFTVEWRDASGRTCSFQRAGTDTPVLDLGTVDRFRDGYTVQLFDEMRPHRKRAGGTVTLGGKWFVADSLAPEAKVAALVERKLQWEAEVVKGNSGELLYGAADSQEPIFNQTVRVLDFNAEINRLKYFIDWTMTASWTRFPNESDYALVELRVGDRQDRTTGVVLKTLTGRIGAPTEEAARAKLATLRAALIPSGYTRKSDNSEANHIEASSNASTTEDGDGATFTELTVSEEWQKTSGQVLSYTMRRSDDNDVKTAWIRTSYSGTVTASGVSSDSAFEAAEALAASLGDGKYPFRTRASVTESSFLVQTDGAVIVSVEFVYEYQRKDANTQRIYTEVTGELSEETFGYSVETVSGFIIAATLAIAQSTYRADVRNTGAYNGLLLLNERQLTLNQQRLDDPLNTIASGDDRYTFSFQVFRPKTATQTAMAYTLQTEGDIQAMEKRTLVNGSIYAPTEAAANALVDTLMAELSLGKRLKFRRVPHYEQGPKVNAGADPVRVFLLLEFGEEWIDLLTGVSGLLETECAEDISFVLARVTEKPLPDGMSILQKPGSVPGRRVVTARALAVTEAAARNWVKGIRDALLTGSGDPADSETYVTGLRLSTRFLSLQQTALVPRGTGANPKLVEVTGSFEELLTVASF